MDPIAEALAAALIPRLREEQTTIVPPEVDPLILILAECVKIIREEEHRRREAA